MRIFDDERQFFGFLKRARSERVNGAIRIGLFGSRARGTHVVGCSDVDMMVEKNVGRWGDYDCHDEYNIQVVRAPAKIDGDDENSHALRRMRSETRWVWMRKDDRVETSSISPHSNSDHQIYSD